MIRAAVLHVSFLLLAASLAAWALGRTEEKILYCDSGAPIMSLKMRQLPCLPLPPASIEHETTFWYATTFEGTLSISRCPYGRDKNVSSPVMEKLVGAPLRTFGRIETYRIPLPPIAATAGLIGGLVLIWPYVLRLARRRSNRCQKCGYDLRGNVSGVCPECGTTVPNADTEA